MPNYKTLRLIILAGLLVGVFASYRYIMPTTNTKMPTSYEDCTAIEGSYIRQIYPPQCVTKDGKVFTQEIEDAEPNFP